MPSSSQFSFADPAITSTPRKGKPSLKYLRQRRFGSRDRWPRADPGRLEWGSLDFSRPLIVLDQDAILDVSRQGFQVTMDVLGSGPHDLTHSSFEPLMKDFAVRYSP